jgi:hypothetical protein
MAALFRAHFLRDVLVLLRNHLRNRATFMTAAAKLRGHGW